MCKTESTKLERIVVLTYFRKLFSYPNSRAYACKRVFLIYLARCRVKNIILRVMNDSRKLLHVDARGRFRLRCQKSIRRLYSILQWHIDPCYSKNVVVVLCEM